MLLILLLLVRCLYFFWKMKSIYLSEFKMQTTEHKKHWLSIPEIWPTVRFSSGLWSFMRKVLSLLNDWSSRPEVFCKKGVLRNLTKFPQSLCFQRLKPATLLKKGLWHRWFSVNFVKSLRTRFFSEQLRWLLL